MYQDGKARSRNDHSIEKHVVKDLVVYVSQIVFPANDYNAADLVGKWPVESKVANACPLQEKLHKVRRAKCMDRAGVNQDIRFDHRGNDGCHVILFGAWDRSVVATLAWSLATITR
ncbi:hypothetical protein GCM10011408_37370 [Dyella caseinilytica]|nr:hypothetical protein GCM10011408_37370 [Dyella caseinilytica]